jgi:hypothetical protein
MLPAFRRNILPSSSEQGVITYETTQCHNQLGIKPNSQFLAHPQDLHRRCSGVAWTLGPWRCKQAAPKRRQLLTNRNAVNPEILKCSLPCSQELATSVPILSQMNPIHALTFHFPNNHSILFFQLRRVYKWSFQVFPIKIHMQVSCLPHASYISRQTHPPNADHPYNSGEEYELWSPSLRSVLHSPITPSPLCFKHPPFLKNPFSVPI